MKLSQLRALTAVADLGTVLSAAERLHLTQSAVSKAVKELEGELGVPLLRRTATGMVLTPCGQLVVKRARLIDSEVARIRDEVAALDGVQRGHLSIGLTPVTAQAGVARGLVKLRQRHPEAAFTVHEERPQRLYAMVREGLLDLAVSSEAPPASSGCQSMLLTDIANVACVRKGHPLRKAGTLSELLACEWLTLDEVEDRASPVARCFESQGLPLPARVTRCASMNVYAELAAETDAVSLWSTVALKYPALNQRVQRLELKQPLPSRQVSLVCLDFDLLTTLARDAVHLLSHVIRDWRDDGVSG